MGRICSRRGSLRCAQRTELRRATGTRVPSGRCIRPGRREASGGVRREPCRAMWCAWRRTRCAAECRARTNRQRATGPGDLTRHGRHNPAEGRKGGEGGVAAVGSAGEATIKMRRTPTRRRALLRDERQQVAAPAANETEALYVVGCVLRNDRLIWGVIGARGLRSEEEPRAGNRRVSCVVHVAVQWLRASRALSMVHGLQHCRQ